MTTYNNKEIWISGAGSTGLSAALFLSDLGYRPRITEKRSTPSTITKALGVNPNTLKLLENTGVTKRFLENGWKNKGMNFWHKGRIIYRNDFSGINHPYPFMLIQPQFETEHIMEEALAERGIFVERGITMESVAVENGITKITHSGPSGGTEHIDFTGILLGADGNKSAVRQSMGIDFRGWEHKEEFKMYDIELDTSMSTEVGHYLLFREGGMLMLHIRNGVWRVGGNMESVLDYLPKGTKTGNITWETTFTIREKVAAQFSKGNVFLLGDAAHIHSPVGARGMNLCIEDSFIFSQLIKDNRAQDYHHVRRPEIKKAVSILGQLTDKVGGRNLIGNTLRGNLDKFSFLFPLIMPRMKKFLLGIK